MANKLDFQKVDLIRDALDWYADHLVSISEGLEKTDEIRFGGVARRYRDRAGEAHQLYAEFRGKDLYTEDPVWSA